MKINFIWAEDEAGWIGKQGGMSWHLSADLKNFKRLTSGHPVIMGATTFHSLNDRPLPKRTNLVLTHQHLAPQEGLVTFTSVAELDQWLRSAGVDEAFVIGGARVYAQFLDRATTLYRTVVAGDHAGDTKMPPIDYAAFTCSKKTAPLQEGTVSYRFEVWQRN